MKILTNLFPLFFSGVAKGNIKLLLFLCVFNHLFFVVKAQDIASSLTLNHEDWVYNIGEEVVVSGLVKHKGQVINNINVKYEIGPEMMLSLINGSIVTSNGAFTVSAGTMQQAGFLRCVINVEYEGQQYREVITAAFNPEQITPTVGTPYDLMTFWKKSIEINRSVPLDPQMTLLASRSTNEVNVYEISFQNTSESRIYGILCIPNAPGVYPAIFNPPGAGVHKINGDLNMAKRGFITLQIGIHGIPLNMDESEYDNLASTTLSRYRVDGMNNRDTYYFKRVFLGCVKAIDFIYTLPQFDGQNLAASGGSQGGALALVTTALDDRIKYLACYAPALSDLTGYLCGRAGGWPHMFKNMPNNQHKAIYSLQYYDVVNFAKQIKVPGLYSWGYNDETTPPTTMFATYNTVTAPKELFIEKKSGHEYSSAQTAKRLDWLQSKLKPN